VYEDSGSLETRNRFIVWRTSHDGLELVETSMDSTLTGNRVKYRFQVSSGTDVVIFEIFVARKLAILHKLLVPT
jgi:hypothetical protein